MLSQQQRAVRGARPFMAGLVVVACCLLLVLAPQPTAGYDMCCASTPLQLGPNGKTLCLFGLSPIGADNDAVTISNIERDCRRNFGHPDNPGEPRPGDRCLAWYGASGDPHITGFDGSSYLLWGKPNATYNLLSQHSHHVNVHLYHPPGRADGHALYIDAVGVLIGDARIGVQLVPAQAGAAGAAASMALTVNGVQQPIAWSGQAVERAIDAHISYGLRNEHHIVITSSDITLSVMLVENDHLDLHVDEVAGYWSDVHGVMGQTYTAAFNMKYNFAQGKALGDLPGGAAAAGKKKLALQGEEDDYVTSGLFQTDDKFSRFVGLAVPVSRKVLTATAHGMDKVQCNAGVAMAIDNQQQSAQARKLHQMPQIPLAWTCQLS